MSSKPSSRRADFLLIVVSLVLALGVAELLIRVVGPATLGLKAYSDLRGVPYPAQASPYLPFTTPTNKSVRLQNGKEYDVTLNFNRFGYRGSAPQNLAKDNRRRVLVLGDSYTLGWGVNDDETYAAALQRHLGDGYEVINAAYRGGVSSDCYYAYLKKEGLSLRPDVVVLGLTAYAGVHFMDQNVWEEQDETGAPTRIRTTLTYTDIDGYVITGLPWYMTVPVLRESYVFVALSQMVEIAHGLIVPPKRLIPSPLSDESYHRYDTTLGALSALLRSRNVLVKAIFLPGPFAGRTLYRRDNYDRMIQIISQRLGENFVPLRPVLQVDDYLYSDGHLSPTGHEKIGQILADLIQKALP